METGEDCGSNGDGGGSSGNIALAAKPDSMMAVENQIDVASKTLSQDGLTETSRDDKDEDGGDDAEHTKRQVTEAGPENEFHHIYQDGHGKSEADAAMRQHDFTEGVETQNLDDAAPDSNVQSAIDSTKQSDQQYDYFKEVGNSGNDQKAVARNENGELSYSHYEGNEAAKLMNGNVPAGLKDGSNQDVPAIHSSSQDDDDDVENDGDDKSNVTKSTENKASSLPKAASVFDGSTLPSSYQYQDGSTLPSNYQFEDNTVGALATSSNDATADVQNTVSDTLTTREQNTLPDGTNPGQQYMTHNHHQNDTGDTDNYTVGDTTVSSMTDSQYMGTVVSTLTDSLYTYMNLSPRKQARYWAHKQQQHQREQQREVLEQQRRDQQQQQQYRHQHYDLTTPSNGFFNSKADSRGGSGDVPQSPGNNAAPSDASISTAGTSAAPKIPMINRFFLRKPEPPPSQPPPGPRRDNSNWRDMSNPRPPSATPPQQPRALGLSWQLLQSTPQRGENQQRNRDPSNNGRVAPSDHNMNNHLGSNAVDSNNNARVPPTYQEQQQQRFRSTAPSPPPPPSYPARTSGPPQHGVARQPDQYQPQTRAPSSQTPKQRSALYPARTSHGEGQQSRSNRHRPSHGARQQAPESPPRSRLNSPPFTSQQANTGGRVLQPPHPSSRTSRGGVGVQPKKKRASRGGGAAAGGGELSPAVPAPAATGGRHSPVAFPVAGVPTHVATSGPVYTGSVGSLTLSTGGGTASDGGDHSSQQLVPAVAPSAVNPQYQLPPQRREQHQEPQQRQSSDANSQIVPAANSRHPYSQQVSSPTQQPRPPNRQAHQDDQRNQVGHKDKHSNEMMQGAKTKSAHDHVDSESKDANAVADAGHHHHHHRHRNRNGGELDDQRLRKILVYIGVIFLFLFTFVVAFIIYFLQQLTKE